MSVIENTGSSINLNFGHCILKLVVYKGQDGITANNILDVKHCMGKRTDKRRTQGSQPE